MPLTLADTLPADAPEQEYLWTLNFGPQHPATHTTLRLILTLDGEKVVDAVPHIGYLHSGFEKLGEHLDFNQYVTIVDRMNYLSPLANEISWHHAVEKLLGIELTPRCKYVRTILAELMRLHDHLLNVGAVALDLGAFTAFLYLFEQREKIYDIVEYASGQRFHTSYTRVGGALFDVNNAWVDRVRTFVKEFPQTHAEVHRLLTRNRIFIDRMKGIGVLSKEDAISFSATGPMARASGVVSRLAQGRAVPGVSRSRFPGRVFAGVRLLRPVPGAHAGNAGEPEDHRAGDREHPGRTDEYRCRQRPGAAGEAFCVPQH
jgi:NADH-quinone oxidoreductase subunit D